MAFGGAWGSKEELLHPRDSKGRFRSSWKMADSVVDKIMATLDGGNPKMFGSDQEAQTYVHTRARADRHLTNRKPAIDRFLKDYSKVNTELEAGNTSNPDVKTIDAAMKPLPDDLILSRTMTPESFGLNANNIGQIEELNGKLVSSKGYTSAGIGTPYSKQPGQITMTIATPKGTKGVIPNTSQPSKEIILERGQPLRITKVDSDGQGGWNILAVASGDSDGEAPVDIARAVPDAGVQEVPDTGTPNVGTPETPVGDLGVPVKKGPGRPAGPGPGPRNDGHVGTVGQGGQAPGETPAVETPGETPSTPPVDIPDIPESGPDSRNTFRGAFEEADIKVPSVGKRRKEFNDAYLGVASGKKSPQDAVRDLDNAITMNKKTLASDLADGTDSGPLPEDIKRQEALRDLIAEHFNFTGRKRFKGGDENKGTTPAKKTAPPAKKAAPPAKKTTGSIAGDLRELNDQEGRKKAAAKKAPGKKTEGAIPHGKMSNRDVPGSVSPPVQSRRRGTPQHLKLGEISDRRLKERKDKGESFEYTEAHRERLMVAFREAATALYEGKGPDELDALAFKHAESKDLNPENVGILNEILKVADDLRAGKDSQAKRRMTEILRREGKRDGEEDFIDSLKKPKPKAPVAKKAVPAKKTTATPPSDVDAMTVPQLRDEAKRRGVKIPSTTRRKADIQALLKGDKKSETKHPNPDNFTGEELRADQTMRESYLKHRNPESGWAPIAAIRDDLEKAGFSKEEQDAAMKRIARGRETPYARIIPVANSRALSDKDRSSALRMGGEDHHALRYLDMEETVPGKKVTTPPVKKAPAKKTTPEAPDIDKMTVAQLREEAKRRGVTVPTSARTKADIKAAVEGKESPSMKAARARREERTRLAEEKKKAREQEIQARKDAREAATRERKAKREQEKVEREQKRVEERERKRREREQAAAEDKRRRAEETRQRKMEQVGPYDTLTGPEWTTSMLQEHARSEGIKVPTNLRYRSEIRDYIIQAKIDKRARDRAERLNFNQIWAAARNEGIKLPSDILLANDAKGAAAYVEQSKQYLSNMGIDPAKYKPRGTFLEPHSNTQFPRRDEWERAYPKDMDANHPIPLDGFKRRDGYEFDHGVMIRHKGTYYMIETHKEDRDNPYVMSRIIGELEDIQAKQPGAKKIQHQITFALKNDPDDEYFRKKFNDPTFMAAASAGYGQMNLWSSDRLGMPSEREGTLNHEYGHNVEWFFAGRNAGIAEAPQWRDGIVADHENTPPGRFVGAKGAVGNRAITREPDFNRAWPYGITTYGKATPGEDFAESMRLYMLLEPIGTLDGKPVWFRDIFPNRAKQLDKLLPDFAKIQEEAKRRYVPGVTKSHRHAHS